MSVEDLMSIEGVDEDLAKKLIEAGIPNVFVLASKKFTWLTHPNYGIGIDHHAAKQIIAAARKRCDSIFPFKTGEELTQEFKKREYLTTGIKSLDNILYERRGLQTQLVYELYGHAGGGKSDLLHQLVCTTFLPPDQGGLGAGAIYIDTEGMFSLKKISKIARQFGINYEGIKRNILRASPPDSKVLHHFCTAQLGRLAHERGTRLVCLDNLATRFQVEYEGMGTRSPERSQKVNEILQALRRVAQQTNGVVIYTNQITKWGEPALGNVVKHAPNIRILVEIKNLSKGLRRFRIVKTDTLHLREAVVKLSSEGFSDQQTKSK